MLSKIHNMISETIKVFRPINTTSSQNRKEEILRLRGVYLTAIVSLFAKIISMLSMFITIPATLNYLGNELFGVWMTISSLVAMLTFADMGIGNGIINKLSKSINTNDKDETKKIITNAFLVLFVIAVAINIVFTLISHSVNWNFVLNLSAKVDTHSVGNALFVFVLCFGLNIIFSAVQKIQLAYQLGFLSSVWQIIGSVCSLALLFIFIHFKLEMAWLVFAVSGVPALFQFINYLYFSIVICKENLLIKKFVEISEMKSLLSAGGLFFALQISMALTYTSDNIILNSILGAEAVAEYSVHIRLFSIIPILMGMVLIPLWPAYSSARIKKDNKWIKKVWNKSIIMALFVSLSLGSLILLLLPTIFELWLNDKIQPMYSLAYLLFIWKIFEALGLTISCFLNGMNLIKSQAIIAVTTAIVALILKIVLAKLIGLNGVLLGTLLPFTLMTFVPTLFIALNFLKKGKY
ncbi:TPA: lipopolysaccharide biosynthesis protein [Citrobacter amalonaticus]